MGVTSLCFGVPPGYGLFFPRPQREKYDGQDANTTGFRQVICLSAEWFTWQPKGRHLTPAHTAKAVFDN